MVFNCNCLYLVPFLRYHTHTRSSTKFAQVCRACLPPCKILSRPIRGFISTRVRLRAPKCLLGYFYFNPAHSQDATMDTGTKYVEKRGSTQGCAFLGLQNQNLTFMPSFSPKKLPFWSPIATVLTNFCRIKTACEE